MAKYSVAYPNYGNSYPYLTPMLISEKFDNINLAKNFALDLLKSYRLSISLETQIYVYEYLEEEDPFYIEGWVKNITPIHDLI